MFELTCKTNRKYSQEDLQEIVDLYHIYEFSPELIGSFYSSSYRPITAILKNLGKYCRERDPTTKKCTACGIIKSKAEYHQRSGTKQGTVARCITCINKQSVKGTTNSLLSKEQTEDLVSLFNSGISIVALASKFNVSGGTARNYILRATGKTSIRKLKEVKDHKACNCCGTIKNLSEFYNNVSKYDGKLSVCISCNFIKRNSKDVVEASRIRRKLYRERSRDKIAANKAYRRARKFKATPTWANLSVIKKIYKEAHKLSKSSGTVHHVDHIVPLNSNIVCGLHCEDNLQILPAFENLSKGNKYWPNMPERI